MQCGSAEKSGEVGDGGVGGSALSICEVYAENKVVYQKIKLYTGVLDSQAVTDLLFSSCLIHKTVKL